MEEGTKTGHHGQKSGPKRVVLDGRVDQNVSSQSQVWTKTYHPRQKSGLKHVTPDGKS